MWQVAHGEATLEAQSFPSYASYAAGLPSLAAFGARTEVTHCTNVALAESELVAFEEECCPGERHAQPRHCAARRLRLRLRLPERCVVTVLQNLGEDVAGTAV